MAWEGSTRKARLPGNWKSIRASALKRDKHRCQWVVDSVQCSNRATDVDHILLNDDHTLSNLQSLCRTHHTQKTQRELADIRNKRYRKPEAHPGLSG